MAREVTVATVQLPAFRRGRDNAEKQEENFRAAEHWLSVAGQRGADIACLGETFNTLGLDLSKETVLSEVESACSQAVARLGGLARTYRMAVIAPVLGLIDGVPRNVALVLDRNGQHMGSYVKVHCIENERSLGVVPGDAWPVFELDFGTIGIQICHDNSFPESARCLTLNGAEIIFWPHVMGGWGGEFMDILLRAPAIHNGVYHVPTCFGCDPDRAWQPGMLIGRSSIIAPDATIVADAGRYVGLAMARIDLDRPRLATSFTRGGDYVWGIDMRNDRRPDTYAPVVRPHTPVPPVAAQFSDDIDQEELS
ncbi:carbon-nitrogen hydrolase family protein [Aggregatilinea lenta]|uniref:carbon-nitrogen hydrolase family protein n=1 Tax=Aggregatilinea lenta TaxID=913108 RepID=UPI0013C2F830|nr:carbon-nitrogen hydrolase family protein [Aggregatilinea lenta]